MPRILLFIVVWLSAVPAAHGHAVLLDTTPAADAALAETPGELVLRFSEPVSPIAVRLLDSDGSAVAEGAVARGASVVLQIPPLGEGGYLLTWRVVSADAHPVGGAFRFTVGSATSALGGVENGDADWTVASAIHRASYLTLLLLGAGSVVFLAVFQVRTRRPPPFRSGSRLLLVGAALLALCLVPLQGAVILGAQFGAVSASDLLAAGIASPVARGGLASAALLVVAAAFARQAPAVAALSALAAVATLGLSGHAAGGGPRWLMAPSLAVHAILAGLWAGALLALRACITRLSAQEAAAILRAFSRAAVPGVVLLLLAGGILTFVQVRELAGFLTPYGLVLALKLAGVGILLGIAILNRNHLTPVLAAGRPDAVRRLRFSIGLEIAVMFFVVASVAVLGHLPPPRAIAAANDAAHSHQEDGRQVAEREPTEFRVAAQGFEMQARVTAGADGGHHVVAQFEDAEGGRVEPLEVEIAITLPELGVEPIRRTMAREGDAYALHTRDLSLPGEWRIEVVALISAFERVQFPAEILIEP